MFCSARREDGAAGTARTKTQSGASHQLRAEPGRSSVLAGPLAATWLTPRLLPSISPAPAGRLLLPSRASPRAAVIRRWCWAIAAQKDELKVIYSSKIRRQAFGQDPGFLLISPAGGRESCSSFQRESAEKRGETFLFELSAASRLLLPWRVSCGHVCRSAGRHRVMDVDHGRTYV